MALGIYCGILGENRRLSRDVKDVLTEYVKKNSWALKHSRFADAGFLKFLICKKLLRVDGALWLLDVCEDVECRTMLLSFLNTSGGKIDIDKELGFLD